MNGTSVSYVSKEGTTMETFARMTAAELLKLYRRRALMAWSVALFVGGQIVFYGLGAIQHAADPAHNGPAGGSRGLVNAMMLVGLIDAAVLVARRWRPHDHRRVHRTRGGRRSLRSTQRRRPGTGGDGYVG